LIVAPDSVTNASRCFAAVRFVVSYQIIDAFKVFDADGSGKITGADLKHVMTSIGEKLSPEQADSMMTEADVDAGGKVDYEEFVKNMMGK
jgi:calmodulin